MSMRRAVWGAIGIGAYLSAGIGSPAVDVSRPGDAGVPTPIEFRVYIIDVDGISSAEQNFTANIFVHIRWQDPRLAHDGSSRVALALNDMWHPGIQFVNQQRIWRTFPETG